MMTAADRTVDARPTTIAAAAVRVVGSAIPRVTPRPRAVDGRVANPRPGAAMTMIIAAPAAALARATVVHRHRPEARVMMTAATATAAGSEIPRAMPKQRDAAGNTGSRRRAATMTTVRLHEDGLTKAAHRGVENALIGSGPGVPRGRSSTAAGMDRMNMSNRDRWNEDSDHHNTRGAGGGRGANESYSRNEHQLSGRDRNQDQVEFSHDYDEPSSDRHQMDRSPSNFRGGEGGSRDSSDRNQGTGRSFAGAGGRSDLGWNDTNSTGSQLRGNGDNGAAASGTTVGPHKGRGPKGYTRSDERIREDISDRLTDDSEIDASEIEIEVAGGEVTISGFVTDRIIKRKVEDLADAVSGVKHVQNNVRVKLAGDEESTLATDRAAATRSGKRVSR